jgi:hypothetical protein
VETKQHGTVLNFIYNASWRICTAKDVGKWWLAVVALYQEIPFKIHKEFLFKGYCGSNMKVAAYRGGQTCSFYPM